MHDTLYIQWPLIYYYGLVFAMAGTATARPATTLAKMHVSMQINFKDLSIISGIYTLDGNETNQLYVHTPL